MLFTASILSKKDPLGIIWHAHLGTKLRRKDVFDVDFGTSIDAIMNPDAHLAPRLSAQLMSGVVRLFCGRLVYVLKDCSLTTQKGRQTFVRSSQENREAAVAVEEVVVPQNYFSQKRAEIYEVCSVLPDTEERGEDMDVDVDIDMLKHQAPAVFVALDRRQLLMRALLEEDAIPLNELTFPEKETEEGLHSAVGEHHSKAGILAGHGADKSLLDAFKEMDFDFLDIPMGDMEQPRPEQDAGKAAVNGSDAVTKDVEQPQEESEKTQPEQERQETQESEKADGDKDKDGPTCSKVVLEHDAEHEAGHEIEHKDKEPDVSEERPEEVPAARTEPLKRGAAGRKVLVDVSGKKPATEISGNVIRSLLMDRAPLMVKRGRKRKVGMGDAIDRIFKDGNVNSLLVHCGLTMNGAATSKTAWVDDIMKKMKKIRKLGKDDPNEPPAGEDNANNDQHGNEDQADEGSPELKEWVDLDTPDAEAEDLKDQIDDENVLDDADCIFTDFPDLEVVEELAPRYQERAACRKVDFTSRTRFVLDALESAFDNAKVHNLKRGADTLKNGINMSNLMRGKTRRDASRWFFECMVLQTRGYVEMAQKEGLGDITIAPGSE